MRSDRANVGIVGGGLAGVALAYYLARTEEVEVTVLERAELGAGSTAASFGGVRQQFSTPLEIELSKRGLEFWKAAESRFDWPCPFHEDGYLFVTAQAERMRELENAAALQRALGCGPAHVVAAADMRELAPWFRADAYIGGVWTPEDGRVNATDGVAAMARECRALGVHLLQHTEIHSLAKTNLGWVAHGTDAHHFDRLVVAAGLGTPDLLEPVGFRVPIRPFRIQSALTDSYLEGRTVPVTLDFDTGLCVEREGPGIVMTVLDATKGANYTGAEMLDDLAETSEDRAPALLRLRVRQTVFGDADMTIDGQPYVGELADGLWMLAGFAGHGVMHAPVLAEDLAALILGGAPKLDLSSLHPERPAGAEGEWMDATRKDVPPLAHRNGAGKSA